MLFLSNWIDWLNINIITASIDISIDIPCPVATLGRYFTTLVWHPYPDPLPALIRLLTVCVADDNLLTDIGMSLEGKLPGEGSRPPTRHRLLEQGIHPHPGPMQVEATEDDGVDDFDPNTFLFLGSDPMHYGLSPLGMQGPSEFFAAGPSDTVNDSETSEEELIEDRSDSQPPTSFRITGGDDDDDDELGEDDGNQELRIS